MSQPPPDTDFGQLFEGGLTTFSRLFTLWMDKNDWSHPVMVALARGCLGDVGWLHSSQISGLRHAKLRSPGPRTFVAIAELNRCLWEYREHKRLLPGSDSSNFYQEQFVITEDGLPPSLGWFVEIFCGTRVPKDIPLDRPMFSSDKAAAISKDLARRIRRLIVQKGDDPIDDLDEILRHCYPIRETARLRRVKELLTGGRPLSPDELSDEIDAIATLCKNLGGLSDPAELLDISGH